MVDYQVCLDIAEESGAFRSAELAVLQEVLLDYHNNPLTTYKVIEEIREGFLAGFVLFGKVSTTASTWDIYWIVVDRPFRKQGIGKLLLQKAEEYIACNERHFILRVETSGRGDYEYVRRFYKARGFFEAGSIPDFYALGDPLVTFYKQITTEKNQLPDESFLRKS